MTQSQCISIGEHEAILQVILQHMHSPSVRSAIFVVLTITILSDVQPYEAHHVKPSALSLESPLSNPTIVKPFLSISSRSDTRPRPKGRCYVLSLIESGFLQCRNHSVQLYRMYVHVGGKCRPHLLSYTRRP